MGEISDFRKDVEVVVQALEMTLGRKEKSCTGNTGRRKRMPCVWPWLFAASF